MIEGVRSLLEAPSPAVLTTYRKDGGALVSPVWFRWRDAGFEVVIAKGDLKLRHLVRDPRCVLVVFEAVRPFRGVEVRGGASCSNATSVRCERTSRGAISEQVTERGSRPRGTPSQGSCSGSPGTIRASGICRESCRPRRLQVPTGSPSRTRLPVPPRGALPEGAAPRSAREATLTTLGRLSAGVPPRRTSGFRQTTITFTGRHAQHGQIHPGIHRPTPFTCRTAGVRLPGVGGRSARRWRVQESQLGAALATFEP